MKFLEGLWENLLRLVTCYICNTGWRDLLDVYTQDEWVSVDVTIKLQLHMYKL